MPSNKVPKQTKKSADEAVTPEVKTVASEVAATSRTQKSSTAKKPEMAKPAPVKRHRKATPVAIVESVPPATVDETLKKASAAQSVEKPADRVKQPQVVVEPSAVHPVTEQAIAALAYSYWETRGFAHGSAQEDWLRAERELKGSS